MDKKDVIDFFNRCAASWDTNTTANSCVINEILDCADIRKGACVLDVASGTGVLFPYYVQREVGLITGIDISEEMVKIARAKYPDINVICGDAETADLPDDFDSIVVYNALPHFPKPENLIRVLAGHLKTGGRLTVAHGMSRESLNAHHRENANKISIKLMHENDLAKLFSSYLHVDVRISDGDKYVVSGVKEE